MHKARVMNPLTFVLSSLLAASAIGCSAPASARPEPVCLDAGVDTSCAPAYDPTYDAIYTNTLQRSCVSTGVSCHTSAGKQGGLDFSDPEAAFTALKERMGNARAPECSVVVQRVTATDPKVRMPPGRALTAGEQCAIVQWVAHGAHR